MTLPASAQPVGANERINIGLIGTGGRCRHLMRALAKVPNTRMMALCDVYEPNLELAQKLADPKAFTTARLSRPAGRKDVHAVLIASPGPLAHADDDRRHGGGQGRLRRKAAHAQYARRGRRSSTALAKHRKIVQVGTQQRSMPHISEAHEI